MNLILCNLKYVISQTKTTCRNKNNVKVSFRNFHFICMVTTPKVRPERVSVFHESCKRTESQGNRTFPEGDSAELTERKSDRFVDSRVYMGFPLVTILHRSIDCRYMCRE